MTTHDQTSGGTTIEDQTLQAWGKLSKYPVFAFLLGSALKSNKHQQTTLNYNFKF